MSEDKTPDRRGCGGRPLLRDYLLVFFVRNDEQLTIRDVCLKFGVNRSSAQQVLRRMRDSGLLEACNVHSTSTPMLVGRGPALREMLGGEQ